jgi:ribulose-phosphate 3-epimerase
MKKINRVRDMIDATGLDIRLEIDGGVTVDNIGSLARAGVDTFVSGSAIFGTLDYAETIARMRQNIDG